MDDTAPIRKVLDGISVNTDTAHCIHNTAAVVSEQIAVGQVKHRYIVQGLYQTPEGHFFLAFWNKMAWNEEILRYDFVNEAMLVQPEQAIQWVRSHCPEKLDGFIENIESREKSASTTTVTLRMTTELRESLALRAKITDQSINKICLNLMAAGQSLSDARRRVFLPMSFDPLRMPDGQLALNELERARSFSNPEEQELAGYAEALYGFYRLNFPQLLPFIVATFYKLTQTEGSDEYVLCFARWLAKFHRPPTPFP
ncbi:hypothetical protein WK91_34585 [Burkholderia cepacia]|uniref:hypothetical protein n=1 Tax=Burkholderia cepacia TaxID=292 RepID=UPI000759B69B|nr:hypothetical protein [Burkholderia cepacia]KVW05818.1 hypothetical protein WK91_34585 [Burkholderia cepacia]